MNRIKRSLRRWLVPELDTVTRLMDQILQAKEELKLIDKKITFDKPVVFLGSLKDCQVDVKPNIIAEITLAKVDILAALNLAGDQVTVTNSVFRHYPVAIKQQ